MVTPPYHPPHTHLRRDELGRHASEERNRQILTLPLWSTSDIVCAQEFWYSSSEVFDLYVKALAGRSCTYEEPPPPDPPSIAGLS